MTTRERFVRTLTGQPVDRVPFMKVFGGDNAILPQWEQEYPNLHEVIDDLLQFEGGYRGWRTTPVNMDPSQLDPVQVIEETSERLVQRRGDGTVEMIQKIGDYNRHDVDWPIKTMADWREYKAKHLQADDPSRFPANWPDLVREYQSRDYPLQLTHRGVYGFARNRMGDENMAYAFYDQPELMHDLMDSYTDMCLQVWEKMVAEVDFDLIECWEDMAYRSGSLISPRTFREFMTPNYRRLRQFADAHNIPIILVDSDGYIEDLCEVMLESGVNAMYPFEVQSDNDVARVRERFPEMGCVGGLNKQVMAEGKDAIDREMDRARHLIELGRFIPGPDHFVLSDVTFASYRYFMEELREVVMTTTPRQG
ncbi:MAG: uroporphyrinogen decarboxylase family protein [Armatimonadia bacterium]